MAPKTDFAVVVYDPTGDAGPASLVLQGNQMEIWSAETCEELAQLLDHPQPHVVLREVRLAAGMCIDAMSFSEPPSPRVLVVGAMTNSGLSAAAAEEGTFDRTIPAFEIEALVRVLKGSGKNARNTSGSQRVQRAA